MGESLKVGQEMAREYKIMKEFMLSPYACKVFFHGKVDLAPANENKNNGNNSNSNSNSNNTSTCNSHGNSSHANSPDLSVKSSNTNLNDDGTGGGGGAGGSGMNSVNNKVIEKEEFSYIVMELCEKTNLSDLRKSHSGSYFGIKEGALYGIELVRALKSFHDIGYVHRDIKPVCFPFCLLVFFLLLMSFS